MAQKRTIVLTAKNSVSKVEITVKTEHSELTRDEMKAHGERIKNFLHGDLSYKLGFNASEIKIVK